MLQPILKLVLLKVVLAPAQENVLWALIALHATAILVLERMLIVVIHPQVVFILVQVVVLAVVVLPVMVVLVPALGVVVIATILVTVELKTVTEVLMDVNAQLQPHLLVVLGRPDIIAVMATVMVQVALLVVPLTVVLKIVQA
jgi:hypothetical protein